MTISKEMLLLKDYIMTILKNEELENIHPPHSSEDTKVQPNLINSNEQSEEK